MIEYLFKADLDRLPRLRDTMFLDRALQFKHRLNWDLTLREDGQEHDQYDALDPLYVVLGDHTGRHLGSMRLLPTTGRTMINEHFRHLMGGMTLSSPFIWECTRFCLAPDAPRETAAQVLAASIKAMEALGIDHYVGVFDLRMTRVYARLGAAPILFDATAKTPETGEAISAGLWAYEDLAYEAICARGRLDTGRLDRAFAASPAGDARTLNPFRKPRQTTPAAKPAMALAS